MNGLQLILVVSLLGYATWELAQFIKTVIVARDNYGRGYRYARHALTSGLLTPYDLELCMHMSNEKRSNYERGIGDAIEALVKAKAVHDNRVYYEV